MSEEQKEVKPLNIEKTSGKFKIFTNASILPDTKDFQPYLGKPLSINTDEILSIYPSEDEIGTMIHTINGQHTWKVLEDFDTVVGRVNE